MQGGIVARNVSVCPYVRLLNAWIVTKRKKNLSRFLYYMKDYLFSENKEWLIGGDSLLPDFRSTWPRLSEIADFQSIFARSALAVAASEKKFN